MKNTKTIQTILFASLIAAMILPFAGMNIADAVNDNIKEKNKIANDKLAKKMSDVDLAEIPLVASYLDAEGRLITVLDHEKAKESKESYTKKIKDLVGNDVELSVNIGYFERDSCSSRTANCDPLFGSVQVYTSQTGEHSSLTIGAHKGTVEGFVVSGHAIGDGVTGQSVKQPISGSSTVGTVHTNPTLHNRYSDAAFVQLTGSESTTNQIYRTSSTDVYTASWTGTPGYGAHIIKSGVNGLSDGYVIGTGLTVYDATYGTLKDQYAADYASAGGDSGAPVFNYRSSAGAVTLYGIHVGKVCLTNQDPCPQGNIITVFSKWINVQNELGLTSIP